MGLGTGPPALAHCKFSEIRGILCQGTDCLDCLCLFNWKSGSECSDQGQSSHSVHSPGGIN